MIGVAITILISGIAAWTIPDNVPGTVADGAQTIVFLQGLAFNAYCLGYGIYWLTRNWGTVRQFLTDLRNYPL